MKPTVPLHLEIACGPATVVVLVGGQLAGEPTAELHAPSTVQSAKSLLCAGLAGSGPFHVIFPPVSSHGYDISPLTGGEG